MSLYSSLPTISLDAAGFAITVAPARARDEEGGTATKRSSQISMPILSVGISVHEKMILLPKGTVSPHISISIASPVNLAKYLPS